MSVVNKRVEEVLHVKFRLGPFDHPYVECPDAADTIVDGARSRRKALRGCPEAIVLLKNENKLLPLDMSKINTIAVVGPGAKEIKGLRIPDGPLDFAAKSVYQGIKDDAPSGLKVLYAKGINYTDPHWSESDVENFALTDQEKQSINTTVAVARQWI